MSQYIFEQNVLSNDGARAEAGRGDGRPGRGRRPFQQSPPHRVQENKKLARRILSGKVVSRQKAASFDCYVLHQLV
jgi:hypothetical protein